MGERPKFSVEDTREIVTMAISLGRPGVWASGGVFENVRRSASMREKVGARGSLLRQESAVRPLLSSPHAGGPRMPWRLSADPPVIVDPDQSSCHVWSPMKWKKFCQAPLPS